MTLTFDGPEREILLDTSTLNYTAAGIYSRWKDWAAEQDNLKFPPAFRVVGGDELGGGSQAPSFFFLRNDTGWRLRRPSANIDVQIFGNLVAEDATQLLLEEAEGNFSPTISLSLSNVATINVADFWRAALSDFPDPATAGNIVSRILQVAKDAEAWAEEAARNTQPTV